MFRWLLVLSLMWGWSLSRAEFVLAADPAPIRILFLGDNGHHRPAERAAQLVPVMAKRGIDIRYTDEMGSLNPETLAKFDGLMIYANIGEISPAQETALLDYVASGKGLIPLHCATYCFLNSPKYIALVGGQFQRHGFEVFRTRIDEPGHPLMQGFTGFESLDESYVHHKHNDEDRIVLERRVDRERAEPYTWVRTHGQGRVFYTAWGHDEKTWGHPGFQNLVERGVRWAVGGDPQEAPRYTDPQAFSLLAVNPRQPEVAPFEDLDVGTKIPTFLPTKQWGSQGEAFSQMQQPLAPEESQKHYQALEGFAVELFASENDMHGKPIAMNWDERGRLWLCQTFDYPNELQPRGQGRDQIEICEDTDGDGRADKFTVFAKGLSIPTALIFARGGVIVQDGTETVLLKDTNGDDVADDRQVLFTGWGLGDTHGGVSNFQYGLDNWIWAMQGYNDSAPVVKGQKQQSFRMGFFRFRPDGSELEFIRSTNNNTWGFVISEEGVIFGSTANHNPSVYMPIANRYYERVRGWGPEVLGTIANSHLFRAITDKVRQVDQFGGYTAGAGHSIYTARTYPRPFWNRTAFVCEPTGHLVGTFLLSPQGSDFKSASPVNLVASDDEWAAPIMAEVGPDGNVWVLDWYNYIVQHNPTPAGFQTGKGNAYETDLRDRKHGRIYRVAYRGETAKPGRKTLAGASPAELVAALKDGNAFWRRHAQRLLIERGSSDVVPALLNLVKDGGVDEIGLNPGAMHALWTLQGLKALDGRNAAALNVVQGALKHPSAGVRRNAIQVLPPSAESVSALARSRVLDDSHPQVRLAAILALADQPPSREAGALVAPLIARDELNQDRWLADATTSAAAVQVAAVLPALGQVENQDLGERGLGIVSRASEHWARGKPSAAEVENAVQGFARMNPKTAEAVLAGLVKGWPKDHQIQLSAAGEQRVVALLERLPAGSKGALIRLGSAWGSRALEGYSAKVVSDLLEVAGRSTDSEEGRLAAVKELISFRANDTDVVGKILGLINAQSTPSLAAGVVESLGGSSADGLGPALVERLSSFTPAVRGVAIRVLLSRPETAGSLLDAIENRDLQLGELKLDQKQALAAHPNK
ncbi:MAG: PVC-type heme-binding CxxCH protein, partial [Planctomycetaceae bacterium]